MSADLVGTVGVDIDVLHAVHTRTERAVADPGLELHDRVAHERTFAPSTPPRVTESAPGVLAAVLRDQVAAARAVHLMFTGALRAWTPGTGLPASVRLLTHDVRRYDRAPSTGRPPGEVGPHGALSSVEALVVDDDALDAAYGGRTRPRHDHARADPVDLQRDPPPAHQPAKPRQTWHPSPAALVPGGDDDTRPAPVSATTADEKPRLHDHDLRLQY
jgi:hypothetical protein